MLKIERNMCGLLALSAAGLCVPAAARADEGMWPLNRLPLGTLQNRYDFRPDDGWIEHVQKACVRMSSGGSASFVSPHGLVMTNHHVGSSAIANLSTAEHNYMDDGFLARTPAEELAAPNLKLYQLVSIEDVTAQVNADVGKDMAPQPAQAVRDRAIAAIEARAGEHSALQPEMVSLYHGAVYHLYMYKVFDDVRLVMAPEQGIGFFGGDIDNFNYPRYCLDVCFFRAYENGKPAQVEHYLSWSKNGPAVGELVFMAGNPARTRRMYTQRHLAFLRDIELPLLLSMYNQREVALSQFVMSGSEQARVGRGALFGTQNGRKAFGGILAGLLDSQIMTAKSQRDSELLQFIKADPGRQARFGSAWQDLTRALEELESYYSAYYLLENRRSSFGRLFGIARRLVRGTAEREKPDGERLPEYREAQSSRVQANLFDEAPIHASLDQVLLADGLTRMARHLGGDHEAVRALLAGGVPQERAAEWLADTRLADVRYRRELWDGGCSAVQASADALVTVARRLEPLARRYRDRYEQFDAVQTAAYARIAEAIFEKYGESVYPDATYNLRLSFGTVVGYEERGRQIPPMTRMGGAFAHAEAHGSTPPFNLPPSWTAARGKLDASMPFNFVSTNDIIGGNSGSPAFNRQSEIVGIVFDGNIHSLVWDVAFDERQARSVSVHSAAIIEALRHVYGANALVGELLGSK